MPLDGLSSNQEVPKCQWFKWTLPKVFVIVVVDIKYKYVDLTWRRRNEVDRNRSGGCGQPAKDSEHSQSQKTVKDCGLFEDHNMKNQN